jgi:hypothetical protein
MASEKDPLTGEFLLTRITIDVKAPKRWSDSDAERALDSIEDEVDACIEMLRNTILQKVPDLLVTKREDE